MRKSRVKPRNVTLDLLQYLEAKRHLWNGYFRDKVDDLRGCGVLDDFEQVDRSLLNALVLRPLGQPPLPTGTSLGEDPLPVITLKAKDESAPLQILVGGPPPERERSWRHVEFDPRAPYVIQFIDFFDWDRYSYASFPFVLGRVVCSERSPGCAGRNVLIETHRVTMHV
jgi:hypothetical protein